MADKNRTFAAPAKNTKTTRPSTVCNTRKPANFAAKNSRAKVNKNATILSECDVTMRQEAALPDFDAEHRQIAYGSFLRAMLEDCLVDEKIVRDETDMDIQMAQLANRFQKTMDQLDKTNRRLKDISFVVEQKRLLDLKSNDCAKFYDLTDKSNVHNIVDNLTATEQSCLDKLETNNVDFGYDKHSGHKQLLDAVNEAIEGLDQIKRHSNLDPNKFAEYAKSEKFVHDVEKDRFDLDSLKSEFEAKFPRFSERLLKDASEKVALLMKSDNEEDLNDDEVESDEM
ncbi:uncharacterized protein [Epargyreus clarus]|uniref:uncharacterized protein n=1 Tax=Epargyreus clarus TaxID=520877 RepID=UPI003C2E810F